MILFELDIPILECIDEETGEIFDQGRLDAMLQQMPDEKIVENLGNWYMDAKDDAERCEGQEKRFRRRKEAYRRQAENARQMLAEALHGRKFKCDTFSAYYRKTKSVDIAGDKVQDLPKEFLVFTPAKPNKTALKEAIEGGAVIPGVKLVEKTNVVVK